jgi:hypothetical protein
VKLDSISHSCTSRLLYLAHCHDFHHFPLVIPVLILICYCVKPEHSDFEQTAYEVVALFKINLQCMASVVTGLLCLHLMCHD